MKAQKFNSKTIICEYGYINEQGKTAIQQLYDYIDGLNMNADEGIFHHVEVYGGTFVLIGACKIPNSWSSFIAFSYVAGQVYHLWRNNTGAWNYEQIA